METENENEKMLIHLALEVAENERKFEARLKVLTGRIELLDNNVNTLIRLVNGLLEEKHDAADKERKEDNE